MVQVNLLPVWKITSFLCPIDGESKSDLYLDFQVTGKSLPKSHGMLASAVTKFHTYNSLSPTDPIESL